MGCSRRDHQLCRSPADLVLRRRAASAALIRLSALKAEGRPVSVTATAAAVSALTPRLVRASPNSTAGPRPKYAGGDVNGPGAVPQASAESWRRNTSMRVPGLRGPASDNRHFLDHRHRRAAPDHQHPGFCRARVGETVHDASRRERETPASSRSRRSPRTNSTVPSMTNQASS